jgi:hypothetical protein
MFYNIVGTYFKLLHIKVDFIEKERNRDKGRDRPRDTDKKKRQTQRNRHRDTEKKERQRQRENILIYIPNLLRFILTLNINTVYNIPHLYIPRFILSVSNFSKAKNSTNF